MIVTILSVESRFTSDGLEYRHVEGQKEDGTPTTKIIFNNLQKKWGLLVEGETLNFIMKQSYKDGKPNWNVVDILPVEQAPEAEPEVESPKPQPKPAPKQPMPVKRPTSPPKPVTPSAETPKVDEKPKLKLSDNDRIDFLLRMHSFSLSYAKDQTSELVKAGFIKQGEISTATKTLADSYVDWFKEHLKKWL